MSTNIYLCLKEEIDFNHHKRMKLTGKILAAGLLVSLGLAAIACSGPATETRSAAAPATTGVQQAPAKIVQLSADEFAKKIKTDDVQLVDVRTAGEVATGKIAGAINIDYNGVDFKAMAAKLDPSKLVAVYCKVGGRSARAAKVFQELGFREVVELDGGIISWNASGLPTEK